MKVVKIPVERFTRKWDCRVSSSGFHNGATCTSKDPHGGGWDCRWVVTATFDEEEWSGFAKSDPIPAVY